MVLYAGGLLIGRRLTMVMAKQKRHEEAPHQRGTYPSSDATNKVVARIGALNVPLSAHTPLELSSPNYQSSPWTWCKRLALSSSVLGLASQAAVSSSTSSV